MSKKRIDNDIEELGDDILSDLTPGERLELFVRASAEGREDQIEWLRDTTTRANYEIPELEHAIPQQAVTYLSLMTHSELEHAILKIYWHEAERDRQVGFMLLNEALGRLKHGGFGVDEFRHVEAVGRDGADGPYSPKYGSGVSYLATVYEDLWEELGLELLLDQTERRTPFFVDLASAGLVGYPRDLSGSAYDDVDVNRTKSEAYLQEIRLLTAVVDLYSKYHSFRIVAEDYVGVSFKELLGLTAPKSNEELSESPKASEAETILSLYENYINAFPVIAEEFLEEGEEVDVDFDSQAQKRAETIVELFRLPVPD